MTHVLLALFVTAICGLGTLAFVRDLQRGVVRTGFGTFDQVKSPRRFKVFRALNIALFPLAYGMMLLFWALAFGWSFQ